MFIFYGLFHSFLRRYNIFGTTIFFIAVVKKVSYKIFYKFRGAAATGHISPPPQHWLRCSVHSMVNANEETQIWLSVSWPWRLLLQRIRKCKQAKDEIITALQTHRVFSSWSLVFRRVCGNEFVVILLQFS